MLSQLHTMPSDYYRYLSSQAQPTVTPLEYTLNGFFTRLTGVLVVESAIIADIYSVTIALRDDAAVQQLSSVRLGLRVRAWGPVISIALREVARQDRPHPHAVQRPNVPALKDHYVPVMILSVPLPGKFMVESFTNDLDQLTASFGVTSCPPLSLPKTSSRTHP